MLESEMGEQLGYEKYSSKGFGNSPNDIRLKQLRKSTGKGSAYYIGVTPKSRLIISK